MALGEDGSIRVDFYPETDFKQMVGRLKDYQAAVLRAVLDVPTRLTGPSPSLSKSFIHTLRDEYEHSTGRRAGRGAGPFLRFVMKFRAALDPSYHTTDKSGDERADRSMVDAIQDALRKPRTTARRLTK